MFPGGIRSLQSRNTTKITAARESNRSGRKSLRSGRTTYILAWLVPPPLEIGQLSNLSSKKEILFCSIYNYLFTEEDERLLQEEVHVARPEAWYPYSSEEEAYLVDGEEAE